MLKLLAVQSKSIPSDSVTDTGLLGQEASLPDALPGLGDNSVNTFVEAWEVFSNREKRSDYTRRSMADLYELVTAWRQR